MAAHSDADLALAALRRLVLARPSGPGLDARGDDSVLHPGGEGPTMLREPAYADKRRLEAEAQSASE